MSHHDSLLGSLPPLIVERRQATSKEDGSESPSDSEATLTESDSENIANESDSDTNDAPDFLSDSEQYPIHTEPFCIQDAENTAVALSHCFRVFNPGRHVCKRNQEHGSSFSHCYCGVPLAHQYSQLRTLMEKRAKLQLVKDFNTRIGSFSHYVLALELAVGEEMASLYTVSHHHQGEPETAPMTKLESLSAICEELRIHVNHWNSIKQHLHTSKWLRPLLPSLCLEMYKVHAAFTQLRDTALWWVDKLIHTGLKVFAHSDLERATPEALWSITRGIEEFNSILNSVRQNSTQEGAQSLKTRCNSEMTKQCHHPSHTNSTASIGNSVKPIPFSRVLNILAAERSKYAAGLTYHFFAENDQFLELIQSRQLPQYSWVLPSTAQSDNTSVSTSDYHTSSSTSLSDSMLKIGNLKGPDLSQESSPLVEFASREQEFAGKFLSFVCHSTNLLRKGVTGPSQAIHKPLTSNPGHGASSFSRQDPKRKSVSWGDAADTSVKLQLTHKYMDLLWQNFGGHLEKHFTEMTWGIRNASRGHLGNIIMCNPSISMLLVQMMKQVCFKDLFPSGADTSLLEVARILHASVAMAAWDSAICATMSSRSTDKCHPVMLENSVYVTKTAKLISDAYQPMISVLRAVEESYFKNSDQTRKGGSPPNRMADLTTLQPTLSRLLNTCGLAFSWCQSKSQQTLASRMIGPFLLVVQSDLKMLGDEVGKVLNIPKSNTMDTYHGSNQSESQMSLNVNTLWHQLHDMVAQQQTLSGCAMKQFSHNTNELAREFFKEAMPPARGWRKKSNQAFPTEPSSYVMQAMETILGPIIDGISKLQNTAQLTAISMAVVVMCDAWTEHILKEKIKFSLYGAHQLSLDFGFIKTYLSEYIEPVDVKQSILALEVFKYLSGIVQLLKRQPRPRNKTNARDDQVTEYSESTGSVDHISNSSALSTSDDLNVDSDNTSQDSFSVINSDEWLALRVHGGQRTWRLPSCFPATAEN